MIRVELADPGAFRAETHRGSWFVSAANPKRVKAELERPAFLALDERDQVGRLGAVCDDGTLLYVPERGDRFWLYRTINATREFYFRRDAGGNWVLADHFRNILAGIPRPERKLAENALLDQFLFLFPLADSTLAREVRRMTPGEIRFVETATGRESSRQAEKIAPEPVDMEVDEAVTALEKALGAAFADQGQDDCTLFSGGIDSTLVHLFRPRGSAALTVTIDTPEFAFEVEYAKETARLLDAEWLHVSLCEEGYLQVFQEAVENLGQPVHPGFQPVFMFKAYQSPFRVFWIGDCSDTLFGHPQMRKIFRGEIDARRESLLAEPSDSPRGHGALSNTGPDFRVVRDLFGEKPVSGRIEARLAYVLERGAIRPGANREEHLQVDSLVELFCNTSPAICGKREAAAAFGRETREPFLSRAVLRLANSIPAGRRFFHGGESKPVPKALLRKMLPDYPFYGKKGGSDIPRTRFCQAGPFRDFFRNSALPDFLPSGCEEMLLDPQWDWSYLFLNAAAFSVWQERVLKAEKLERVSGTRVFELGKKNEYLPAEAVECRGS